MELLSPIRSVKKALDLLDEVVQADLAGEPASLSDLARQGGMPANSAHNLLKSLIACGYVQQRVRGHYEMGSKCRQMGRMNLLGSDALQQAILACLGQFTKSYKETCVLASLLNGQRVIIAQVDSAQAVQVSHATVRDEPFFAKPTGRLLAAISDEEALGQILDRHGLPGELWDGIRSESALKAALAVLRGQGSCVVEGPDEGMVAMAVPVAAGDDAKQCVLGAFAPLYRCDKRRRHELLDGLKLAADELTEALTGASSLARG